MELVNRNFMAIRSRTVVIRNHLAIPMAILVGFIPLLVIGSAPPAAPGPTADVSKDSVVFSIPLPDQDAVWAWNTQPRGTTEHQWVIRMPVGRSVGWPLEGTYYLALVQESRGSPSVRGSVIDLIQMSHIITWITEDGDRPSEDRDVSDTLLRPVCRNGVIRIAFYQQVPVERINRIRPADFNLQGVRADGSVYHEPIVVTHHPDAREEQARSISGPLSPDEYAIYQTVIDRAFHSSFNSNTRYREELDFVLLDRSASADVLPTERNSIKILGASSDTVDEYVTKRSIAADLSSLASLGYRVEDADSVYAEQRQWRGHKPWKRSVAVSVIGFNETRTQAIVYVETSTGNLGGEGNAIRLDKVDGEWLVTWRVGLWIS